MELHLRRDDPGLVALLDTLNEQFPYDKGIENAPDGDDEGDASGGHDWSWHVLVVFLVVLVAGLILTLVLNRSPAESDGPSSGHGPLLCAAASAQRVQ